MNNAVGEHSDLELIEITSGLERVVHWFFAISFILLFITGFGMMFHSFSFIPAVFGGHEWMKLFHNYSGLAFVVSTILALIVWFKDGSFFTSDDKTWLKKGGGYLLKVNDVPDPGRFNAGQKLYFILKIVFGAIMSLTGLMMWFPITLGLPRGLVLFCYPLHVFGVVVLAGIVVVHIFLGTANPGTIQAMLTGKVTRSWVRLQHGSWLREYDKEHGKK